jgi:hypothetical protein
MTAYAAPAKANYDFLIKQLTKFLGAADPNYPDGSVVNPNSPYTLQQLRSQLVQSDVEVQALIASVEDHPYRNSFFTTDPVEVGDASRIPGYIGVHGGVEVQVVPEGKWATGSLAQSLEHLQRVQDKLAIGADRIPNSSKKLYFIHNGKLHYLAANARVELPTITAGDDTQDSPELYTPRTLQFAPLAHAITLLRPVGYDQQHRIDWQNVWGAYVQMIMAGASSLPEPERMQRVAE